MPFKKRPSKTARPKLRVSGELPRFLAYLEAECGMSPNTRAAYRSDIGQFGQWLSLTGDDDLRAVDLPKLTAYLEHLHRRRLAASTIARHLIAIRSFFRFLVLEGLLAASAADLLQSPKLWQRLPTVLSPEMVDALLKAPCHLDRYPLRDRALLCMLYATGCRASEVAGLRLGDVHLNEHFCRCLGKGNKERLVALNPVAEHALDQYLRHERPDMVARRRDAPWLFVSRNGGPLSRITVWKLVKKYAARVGCSRKVSPHTLRHSFATHMLANGAELRALQELLGHASVATTQLYTHVEHSRLKSVHRRCHPRG
ncbi:MAG: site-specific tyrosine recombinase XerD [Planctomycetota bacterium]|nr:MAG: site-specific tyrosine recombinase XerD [Planctomycetota bacterium]